MLFSESVSQFVPHNIQSDERVETVASVSEGDDLSVPKGVLVVTSIVDSAIFLRYGN